MPAERPTRQKPSKMRHHPYRDKRAAKQCALDAEAPDLSSMHLSRHIDGASRYLADLLEPVCASNRVPAEMALDDAERRKDVAQQKLSEIHKQVNEMQQELNAINSRINTHTVSLLNFHETMAIIEWSQGCATHLGRMILDCNRIIREKDLLLKLRSEMEEKLDSVFENSRQLKAEEAAVVKAIDHHTDILAFASAHARVARVFHTLLCAGIEGISNTWDSERIESLAAIVNEVTEKQEPSDVTCEKQGGT
ncbi:hypothetical protein NW768_007559 [Fusarium equiseti]|uniref:Uncharacterized protein n=1 Tax=Fusarium equiseti TaxID=61235 RepID=A0ABQ8R7V1_FUSEQ|nr:hypothetical protein NW768_007559 [Fusarium equiseti]